MKLCDHWQDCGVNGGGCCIANHYGGKPSLGICKNVCKHRTVDGVPQKLEKSLPTVISQATQYAAAELQHATQGPADEQDAARRLGICIGCEHRAVTFKGKTDEAGAGWCTKCGCGNNPRALLTVKVTIAGAECPLGKWGKVEGTGATIASAVDAVKGVAKSIIHKLGG